MSKVKKQDDLFDLIKNLSKSEKRYFKMYALGNKNAKNYLLLFDFLSKQKHYDEICIKKHFKGKVFVKQLHVLKNYLFHLILSSLVRQQEKKNIEFKILENIRKASVLLDRSAFAAANKLLERSSKLAKSRDLGNYELQILQMRRSALSKLKNVDQFAELLVNIELEGKSILKGIERQNQYANAYFKAFIFNRKQGVIREDAEIEDLQELIELPILKDVKCANSYLSKCYYYIIWSYYYWYKKEPVKRFDLSIAYIHHMEANQMMLNEHLHFYAAALQTALTSALSLGKVENLSSWLEKYHSLLSNESLTDQHLKHRVEARYFNISLNFYKKTNNENKSLAIAKELSNVLELGDAKFQDIEQLILYDTLCAVYFTFGDFENALIWNNKVLDFKVALRKNILCMARIMNMIIHYEMDNEELLPYLTRNANRFLQTKDNLYKSEKLFVKCFRKLPQYAKTKDKKRELMLLKQALEPTLKDKNEQQVFQDFEIIKWIDSKISA